MVKTAELHNRASYIICKVLYYDRREINKVSCISVSELYVFITSSPSCQDVTNGCNKGLNVWWGSVLHAETFQSSLETKKKKATCKFNSAVKTNALKPLKKELLCLQYPHTPWQFGRLSVSKPWVLASREFFNSWRRIWISKSHWSTNSKRPSQLRSRIIGMCPEQGGLRKLDLYTDLQE